MAVRTVTITGAAYERLAAMKRPGESFTDVVLRLTGRRSLARLPEMLSPAESAALAEAVLAARDERRAAARRRGG
ncbi:MAG TPA: antitoxin VapB family protein [Candidatus Thermoplasmatota archaeon]|nr:antitoxin VapB family protein [Candidatus Thermoplasmatota archaeon]